MTLPTTMRQVRFARAGGPEVIEIETAPLPVAGPGQVLIKVAAAGINRPDCIQRAGFYPPPPGASAIPGLEVAGTIVGVGEGVGAPHLGRQVCALLIAGGYAEYAVAEAALCLPVPTGFSLVEAAALPETCFTVYDNVITRAALGAGESILIHGGSSGIGTTAIQLAKAHGARVFTTAGSPEKCDLCRELGADEAINYREADFFAEVKRLTEKRGVNVILDMVGGDYFNKNIGLLAPDGRLVQIAFLKGSKTEVDFMPMMLKRLTLTGSTLRARPVEVKAVIAERLKAEVWPLIEAGKLRPVIDTVLPLEQARQGHERMEASAHAGKIMLEI